MLVYGVKGKNMGRAALAATRAIQIIDFLASQGTAPFTLSELARALGINGASCHGILLELTRSGHLCRHPVHKTYSLGPVLVAIGDVAGENHLVLGRAKAVAAELSQRLGLEVLLTMRAGDDVLGLAHFKQGLVARAWLRPGVRLPLHPPLGATLIAWESGEEIERWLGSGLAGKADPATAAALRELLASVRKRGFQVTLKTELSSEPTPPTGSPDFSRYTDRLDQMLLAIPQSGDLLDFDPAQIKDEYLYELDFISVPVFDRFHKATYSLTVYHFDRQVSGSDIKSCISTLMASCQSIRRETQ
jgi:DNA-binding IclR family transcriptional regulator